MCVLEGLVDLAAAFEGRRVDQDGARPLQPLVVVVVVAEKLELTRANALLVVLIRPCVAGDVVAHHLRVRRIVAYDDEDGWYADLVLLPETERLLVVSVERVERD